MSHIYSKNILRVEQKYIQLNNDTEITAFYKQGLPIQKQI